MVISSANWLLKDCGALSPTMRTSWQQQLNKLSLPGNTIFWLWRDVSMRIRVRRPSGASEPWTPEALQQELEAINRSLDQAYASAPAIARYR